MPVSGFVNDLSTAGLARPTLRVHEELSRSNGTFRLRPHRRKKYLFASQLALSAVPRPAGAKEPLVGGGLNRRDDRLDSIPLTKTEFV